MARVVRGRRPTPPERPRPPVAPPPAPARGNYFASVIDELRKVVWPTWEELGRMTGVVVTTVVLMAVIVAAADYGLSLVVRQLYSSSAASQTIVPSTIRPKPTATPRVTVPITPPANTSPSPSPSVAPSAAPSPSPATPASPLGTSPITP